MAEPTLRQGGEVDRPPAETAPPAQAGPWGADVAGNELPPCTESGPLVDAMVRDVRRARTRVWLETYIFHDDAAGCAVAEALIARARAGVQVRVLYDAVGSQATP